MLADGRTHQPDALGLAPQVALIVATLALASGTFLTGPFERAVFLAVSVALAVLGSVLWWARGTRWVVALADAAFVLAGLGVVSLNQPGIAGFDDDIGPGLFRDAERLVGGPPEGVAPALGSLVGIVWVVAGLIGLATLARLRPRDGG